MTEYRLIRFIRIDEFTTSDRATKRFAIESIHCCHGRSLTNSIQEICKFNYTLWVPVPSASAKHLCIFFFNYRLKLLPFINFQFRSSRVNETMFARFFALCHSLVYLKSHLTSLSLQMQISVVCKHGQTHRDRHTQAVVERCCALRRCISNARKKNAKTDFCSFRFTSSLLV